MVDDGWMGLTIPKIRRCTKCQFFKSSLAAEAIFVSRAGGVSGLVTVEGSENLSSVWFWLQRSPRTRLGWKILHSWIFPLKFPWGFAVAIFDGEAMRNCQISGNWLETWIKLNIQNPQEFWDEHPFCQRSWGYLNFDQPYSNVCRWLATQVFMM